MDFLEVFFPRGDPLDPAFTRGEVVKIESKPIGASLLIDFTPLLSPALVFFHNGCDGLVMNADAVDGFRTVSQTFV